LRQKHRGQTPIRKGKMSRGNFRGNPRPNIQLGQRKDFKVIHHSTVENDLIPMIPDLPYHNNPHASQN